MDKITELVREREETLWANRSERSSIFSASGQLSYRWSILIRKIRQARHMWLYLSQFCSRGMGWCRGVRMWQFASVALFPPAFSIDPVDADNHPFFS